MHVSSDVILRWDLHPSGSIACTEAKRMMGMLSSCGLSKDNRLQMPNNYCKTAL
jgi:hypothetical protein